MNDEELIKKYQHVELHPEVDEAIQKIVEEATEAAITDEERAQTVNGLDAEVLLTRMLEKEIAAEPKQTPNELAQSDETRKGKHNEWVLIGVQNGTPVWKYDWSMAELNQKYPPAKLRALRAERGVGSKAQRLKKQMAQIAIDNA